MYSLKNINLLYDTHKRDPLYEFKQLNLMIKSTFQTASTVALRIKFNIDMIKNLEANYSGVSQFVDS